MALSQRPIPQLDNVMGREEHLAPTSTAQDRQYLCMDIFEYQRHAEALSQSGVLNKEGNIEKFKHMKTKRLKNLRAVMKKNKFNKSMLLTAIMSRITSELSKRQKTPRATRL